MENLYQELCQVLPNGSCRFDNQQIKVTMVLTFTVTKIEDLYCIENPRFYHPKTYDNQAEVIAGFRELFKEFEAMEKVINDLGLILDNFNIEPKIWYLDCYPLGWFPVKFNFYNMTFHINSIARSVRVFERVEDDEPVAHPPSLELFVNLIKTELLKIVSVGNRKNDYLIKEYILIDDIEDNNLGNSVCHIVNQQTELLLS